MKDLELRKCNKCGEIKELKLFSKSCYACKACRSISSKEYYLSHPLKKESNKNYWIGKKTDKSEYDRNRYLKIKDVRKEYDNSHKVEKRDYMRVYLQKRQSNDVNFKLSRTLRARLHSAIKRGYKSGSAVRDLGCSIDFLKTYLESKFLSGMSWENHGNKEGQWSIDHIKPLSKFDLTIREHLLEACHYTNLQPLWHIDNMKKGNK